LRAGGELLVLLDLERVVQARHGLGTEVLVVVAVGLRTAETEPPDQQVLVFLDQLVTDTRRSAQPVVPRLEVVELVRALRPPADPRALRRQPVVEDVEPELVLRRLPALLRRAVEGRNLGLR